MNYKTLILQTKSLFEGEKRFLPNSANFCSLLFNSLEDLNWVGFYLFDGEQLVLGPFMGKPACIHIGINKGVCGTSFEKNKTLVIDDVHEFPGHISCDSASNSELVIPFNYNGNQLGVFDIDSPIKNRFSLEDKNNLEKLLNIFIENTNLPNKGYLI